MHVLILLLLNSYHKNYYFPASVGQHVDYHCVDGYSTPSGYHWVRIVCSGRGWFPEPKCLKICNARQPENGYFSQSWKKAYKEGERAKYVCNTDYQTEHEGGEVTCTKNGWSSPPRCIRQSECACILLRFLAKTSKSIITSPTLIRNNSTLIETSTIECFGPPPTEILT
uniref:Sushi domain-containing protein n=1 Tax=Otus sunia TaxID=257818 RepID=A0A8C8A8U7_9STRI